MSFTADLHLHSAYAYATSSALTLENLEHWAGLKGIDLLATADFTHPAWYQELKSKLVETGYGSYSYGGVNFVVGTEVSCVFRQNGRGRRVHLLVFAPGLKTAETLTKSFAKYGKVQFDGRPTLSISVQDITSTILEIDADCLVVPAHAWTPWYGLYGSKSGFDSFGAAFGEMAEHIPAIETGLSSDPEMNWTITELADKAIVSFSDAHSLPKLGREVTVFEGTPDYESLSKGLHENRVIYTVEMYPEEGKYHYDGHRKCKVSEHPRDTALNDGRCPECGRPLTLGVLNRVLELGGTDPIWKRSGVVPRFEGLPGSSIGSSAARPPFVRMVPLLDIIAAVRDRGPNTKGVLNEYLKVVESVGNELQVLLWSGQEELEMAAGPELATAIVSAREGKIQVEPGYDGVYGKVSIALNVEGN